MLRLVEQIGRACDLAKHVIVIRLGVLSTYTVLALIVQLSGTVGVL